MTPLTIIPNYDKKRLKCYGTVAAGEHVLVTVTGGTEWVAPDGENQTLRLRLLFGPHTVGVFPFVTDEMNEEDSETFPAVDEWSTDGDDATCDLNLNTIQAAKFLKFGGNCLFVLDDPTNDILYATGEFEVLPWPKRRGADLPYDLDGYPDFVLDAKNAMAEAAETAQNAENAASAAEATATRLEQDVYGHRQAAETAATNAQASANGASNSKQDAEAWAVGERGGAAVGTDDETYHNNAKYYAGQAGDAKTNAETAQDAAESAQAAAEAWATGGTGGTPSATNNAKYYAEQAADSAQDAEEALEYKADKVASATNGNFAGLDSNGNLTDSGKKAADFAPATDIAKTALASDVQTSLGKADSAVQPSDILSDNKIKTALLPSFVDDVLEFSALANFPATGETGKIYVAKDTNKTYRWSGSSYVEISASLALGETSSTAYRGDKGKTAYDHATDSDRLTTAKVSGLYKIATTAEGHVKSVTAVEKSDITALGIPAQDTTYTLPPATASTLGGVKQGTGCTIEQDGTLNVTGGSDTVDNTVTQSSANPVKSSGIWSAIWGALTALPLGFGSLYDYCKGWFADAKSIAPVWDFGILYHVGDLCVESKMGDASGLLYRCKKEYTPNADSDGPSLDTEHWEPVDVTALIANKQDALSAAQLANIAAVPGKADAADLRYRIAEAVPTLPADCFPVTFTYDGDSYSVDAIVPESEASAGDLYFAFDGDVWSIALEIENSAVEVASFSADGVFETGLNGLQFGGVSPVAETSPVIYYAVFDRASTLITPADGASSIDIELPAAVTVDGVRYARDFLLDIDNSANAGDLALEFTGLGVSYAFVPLEDDSISEMMTIGAGERVRLYFTETPYTETGSLPVINVARVTLGDFVTSTTATQGGN